MQRKVFGIGLPRCAGQSLHAALSYLVGCCIHSPGGNWDIFDNHSAFAEVYVHPHTLIERYGKDNCTFILNYRKHDAWLASCESVYAKSDTWNHPLWRYPIEDFTRYRGQYLASRMHATESVFSIDITANPRWDALCDVLGVPIPAIPFPRIDRIKDG